MKFQSRFLINRSAMVIFFIILVSCHLIEVFARHIYAETDVLNDLLVKDDMETFLSALERVVTFTNTHKYFVDFNLSFGIFMIKANCRSILQMSRRPIVHEYRARFEWLLETSDEILKHFGEAITHSGFYSNNDEPRLLRNLVSLYIANDTAWPAQLAPFNVRLLKATKFQTRRELEGVYYTWPKYTQMINYDNLYGPELMQSDSCLSSLAMNPVNHKPEPVQCHVPYTCVEAVKNGADYGYAVPHRIVYLTLARLGRGCTLMSVDEDDKLKDTLCAKIYNEAEYIAQHGYKMADLMLEILSIGGVEGHVQFLRRSWLEELMEFQTDAGCFSQIRPYDIPGNEDYQYRIDSRGNKHLTIDQICSPHTTAVGSIVLASAVRYIAEMEKKTNNVKSSLTLPPLNLITMISTIVPRFRYI